MLKRYLSIFLLLVMISGNFSRFFIYAGFEINRTYIAQALCENRDKPELHCNGKCFVKKKLKEAEEKEKKQERENQRNRYHEVLPTAFACALEVKKIRFKVSYPEDLTPHPIGRSFSIFQPPKHA